MLSFILFYFIIRHTSGLLITYQRISGKKLKVVNIILK